MAQLAQLFAADPSRGWGTDHYRAYTNSGDIAAAFNAAPGQRVQLVDPNTGQVYATGTGPEGAQQIATLATSLGEDLGRKAQWQIRTDQGDDNWQVVGYDRYDPKKAGVLGTIIKIAAPLLGAAIPGLAPMLGAALGGFGGSLATGGSLKQALISAASSGLGNSFGGALGNLVSGTPVSFAGTNALAGLGDKLSGAIAGGSGGGLIGGAGSDVLGGAIGSAITDVAPITVTGALGGGTAGALGSALGSAAGSVLPGVLGGGSSTFAGGYGNDQIGGTMNDQLLQPTQGATELDPVTVTAAGGQTGLPLPGVVPDMISTGYDMSLVGKDLGTQPTQGNDPLIDPVEVATGVVGGVAGDMATYYLADALGLLPKPNLDGVADGGFDQAPSVGPKDPITEGLARPAEGYNGNAGDVGGSVAPGVNPQGGASINAAGGGVGAGGAGGGPVANTGNVAAPSAAGAGGDVDLEGSFSPDIYPWRRSAA